MPIEFSRNAFLHQDLRCLRNAGQQLVRRVCREDHRPFGARPVLADRVHVLVEVVKRRVRQPRLVEVQRIDFLAQNVLQRFDVIQHAVVRALRDRKDSRLLVLRMARERIRLDLLADVFRAEFLQRDRADDAEVIALRRQENRDRAGHRDRVQDRHVTVAVDDDDVVGCDVGVPDDLVRRRRAVGDEITVVGVEDPRGVALRRRDRAGVIEELSELVDRVAYVGAQHVLAEELVEHLSDRRLQERDPARVSRAVPGVRAVLRIIDQRAEKRGCQRLQVGFGFADDVARDEFRRVLEHVNEAVQLAQDVVRNVARSLRLAVQVDRDIGVAEADFLDELVQVQHRRIEFGPRRELLVVNRQDERRSAALLLRELRQVAVAGHAQHFHAFLLDRRGERPDSEAAGVFGAEVLVDDDDGKAKAHQMLLGRERRRNTGNEERSSPHDISRQRWTVLAR